MLFRMKRIENQCVGCPKDMGCIGNACPYMNVTFYECDNCSEDAEYHIDGEDYCVHCAERYLLDIFDELTVMEKAEALGVDIKELYG